MTSNRLDFRSKLNDIQTSDLGINNENKINYPIDELHEHLGSLIPRKWIELLLGG
jgi:hypothetical protein